LIIDIRKTANNDTKLWLADNGRELKNKILDQISKSFLDEIIILDLNKIEIMDTSYAREGFVKLISEIGMINPHPQVLLKNVDEYVKQNLHLSFKDHKIFSMVVDPVGSLELIGKFSEQNLETISALVKRKQASAKQISIDLGEISLTTTINRLNQLNQFCVCSRKESVQPTGGKEYLFKIEI
jgi:anti-anti-sigma regulatory factor